MSRPSEVRVPVTVESGKKRLFGTMHLPIEKGTNKAPCVLFLHGFGGNKVGKYRLFVRMSELLSKNGIASLRIDFRGAGDSEGDFSEMSIQTQLEDALCAIQYLVNHEEVDPSRIGILGRSMGGSIAVLCAGHVPQVKSIVLWAPVFDAKPWIEKMNQNSNTQDRFAIGSEMFTIEKNANKASFLGQPISMQLLSELHSMKACENLEKIHHIPLLHIQGKKDRAVSEYHLHGYMESRKKTSAKSSFLSLEQSDHDFSILEEQNTILEECLSWFKNNI